MTGTAPPSGPVAGASTRLINIDNGGTLTDVCVIDGDEVRYTKTLTTPFDLSSCLFDGLTKASARGVRRGPARVAAADHRLHPVLHDPGHERAGPAQGPTAGPARRRSTLSTTGWPTTAEQAELLAGLVGDRVRAVTIDSRRRALSAELVRQVNDLASSGASRLVVSVGGEDGASPEARLKRTAAAAVPAASARRDPAAVLLGARGRPRRRAPHLVERCSTRSCIRRWSGSCSAPRHRLRGPPHAASAADLPQRRRLVARGQVGRAEDLQLRAARRSGGHPRARPPLRRSRHVLMVDVGGTTTDVGVVDRRRRARRSPRGCRGVPTSFELAAITSHGVGGSSVIRARRRRDRVGPDSVGAAPGPACFGLGGPTRRSPTSTC